MQLVLISTFSFRKIINIYKIIIIVIDKTSKIYISGGAIGEKFPPLYSNQSVAYSLISLKCDNFKNLLRI